ncbi:alpha-2C adrenergic receptor-like [Haliotis asinina]|uniref:alpha-2C adrenergic receptor-like n=1 Tax=Haliotis asinina TaxID=109174 RepID=UPI0035318868
MLNHSSMLVTEMVTSAGDYNATADWTTWPTVDHNTSDADANTTDEPQRYFPAGYPSGYTWAHIIFAAILVTIVMLMIVIGNFLVIWAIITDRNLKATQNLFIASLALADFLIGLIIIPFSLSNELMGYWFFGTIWCELWKAIDVLLCTASISSLCLISLDRYWSITRAIHYSRQRTPKRATIMIAIVWVVSAAVCIPPLIGWKAPRQKDTTYPMCNLSEDIGYVLYSSIGSFYIPAIIMVFVYYKIYQAAKMRARKTVTKAPKAPLGGKGEQKNSTESSVTEHGHGNETKAHDENEDEFEEPVQEKQGHEAFTTDDDTAMHVQTSDTNTISQPLPSDEMAKLISTDSDSTCDISLRTLNRGDNSSRLGTSTLLTSDTESSSEQHRSLLSSNGKERDANTDSGPEPGNGQVHQFTIIEPKQNGTPSVITPNRQKRDRNRFLGNITRHLFNANREKKTPKKSDEIKEKPTDYFSAEKHKRKLAKARERRATVVLGLVMAAFILCWLPFFILYVVSAFCVDCIPRVVFTVFFWIGYCNSALNPIIYTVFNRDFRKAFGKIIFGRRWARRG